MTIFQIRFALASLLMLFLPSLPLHSQQPKESTMTQQQAAGPFDVKITPLDPAFKFDENPYTRFSIDKQFHGDLEATSKGETGQLAGLAGTMQIIIAPGGKHSYNFSYTLPAAN